MSTNEEWHYIQVPKLGRAWVGWGASEKSGLHAQAWCQF